MPAYVDGFVIPVPTKKLADYRRLARRMGKVWIEHGALEVHECAGDDVKPGKLTSFPQAVKLKAGESVVFSWILYKSRRHRDQVNAKVMKDPRVAGMDMAAMPFDARRMFFGGFKQIVGLLTPAGFIWYELLADDVAAATRFYGDVLGWRVRDSGMPGPGYQFISTGEADIGGLMTLPAGAKAMGARPQWLPYVNVADVDARVAAISAAGGAVHMPPADIPGTGRFAMVADPQGAAFYVMAPIGAGPSPSFQPGRYGHGGWHELHARDWRAAREFYATQFGWATVQELDLGAMGTYLQFNAGQGAAIGGMMTVPDIGRPYWLIYFNVDDIEAAKRRLVTAGGTLTSDVHQVPGDAWILRARDPQGAAFALIGPRWEQHRAV